MKNKIQSVCRILMVLMLSLAGYLTFAQQSEAADSSAIMDAMPTMDVAGWILMFLGWLSYWLKKLNEKAKDNKLKNLPAFQGFSQDNIIEIITSVVACFALAILADYIPADLLDMHGKLSIFITGYGSSSILNGLITQGKTLKP